MNTRIRTRLVRQGHILVVPPHRQDERMFFDWFREVVLGLDSPSCRRAFWHAFHTTGHTFGPLPKTFRSWQNSRGVRPCERLSDAVCVCFFVGGPSLLFWLLRRALDASIRKLRRPSYYERERDRRLALGKTRRAVSRRHTTNPRPSIEALRNAWYAVRRTPETALRLGGMLEDLECYVDNRVVGNSATGWRGRRGGIKRFLEREAPDLFAHYAAIMRYKALARRFRQACGLNDPIPADAALPVRGRQRPVRIRQVAGLAFPRHPLLGDGAPLAVAADLLNASTSSVISLEAALALRIDPDCIAAPGLLPARAGRSHAPSRLVAWLNRHMRDSA